MALRVSYSLVIVKVTDNFPSDNLKNTDLDILAWVSHPILSFWVESGVDSTFSSHLTWYQRDTNKGNIFLSHYEQLDKYIYMYNYRHDMYNNT